MRAPALPGHAGGPPVDDGVSTGEILDGVEQMLDDERSDRTRRRQFPSVVRGGGHAAAVTVGGRAIGDWLPHADWVELGGVGTARSSTSRRRRRS